MMTCSMMLSNLDIKPVLSGGVLDQVSANADLVRDCKYSSLPIFKFD